MSRDPYSTWFAFQEEALRLQKQQLDFAQRAMKAGLDGVAFQKSANEAMQTGMKAWQGWLDLWKIGR